MEILALSLSKAHSKSLKPTIYTKVCG